MKPTLRLATSSNTPPKDPNRDALAAAIAASEAAERNAANARKAVETALTHWVDLDDRAEAARKALDDVDARELVELAAAVVAGELVNPGRDLRATLSAEADALKSQAVAARATLGKLREVQANFEGEIASARAKVKDAAKRVLAVGIEPMLAEAQSLARSLGARRHVLKSLFEFVPVDLPLWARLNRLLQHPFVDADLTPAEAEIARWRAAAETLATDATAPLPGVGL